MKQMTTSELENRIDNLIERKSAKYDLDTSFDLHIYGDTATVTR